ncbi:kinase-like domain-containing protein [Tanacetum coccineum]
MSLLSKLDDLVIENNKLTGNQFGGRHSHILVLEKLAGIDSGACNLYGSIPHFIFNLSLLVNLSIAVNHLTGSLPSEIGNQLPNLENLQTFGNGPIPDGHWELITVDCNDFKALVYEYMPNGSVHDWLHSSAHTLKLNLLQRVNILNDVATALDYLHNRCQTKILHGDLKPSNILLDDDMVAHVGDFGLARLLEYGIGNDMTSSGDNYSFEILLLEFMTGKQPTDDMFNEGLSIHKFASMALPDHIIDVIDDDAIVFQSTEVNARKWKECLVVNYQDWLSCSVDSHSIGEK